jgi:hypothetical protein
MNLTSLTRLVGRRLKNLDGVARRVAALPRNDFERERLATFLTTDLYNLNAEWIRSYYILVSTNQAIKKSGRKIVISQKQKSSDDAISYAIEQLNGTQAKTRWLTEKSRFFEPNWGSINTLPRLAGMLNFPDKNQISTSMSAARDSIKSLRVARNYYAHRNVNSRTVLWDQLEDLFGWTAFESPSVVILNRQIGAFSSVFMFWINECERVNLEVCDL